MVFLRRLAAFSDHARVGAIGARRHADARHAAQRVADAIEQLASELPDLEDMQLVQVKAVHVEQVEASAKAEGSRRPERDG
jgi:hypothetical protein